MRLPNNTELVITLPCGECNAALEVDAEMSKTREASLKLRDMADEQGWQPLMLGNKCVNVLCGDCVKAALAEDDEDATENMDAESESEEGDKADQANTEGVETKAA